jgi:hypothetical protein
MQHFTDQELYKWLWEMVMFLHLHQVECSLTVMEFTNTPSTSATKEAGMYVVIMNEKCFQLDFTNHK